MEGVVGSVLVGAGALAIWSAVGRHLFGLAQRTVLAPGADWKRLLRSGTKEEASGTGAWALVTGASMGIGKEYALQLAQRGFNVVIIADPATAAQLEEVARTIAASSGGYRKVLAISEDLLDPAAYDRIAVAIQAIAPDISVLVNNVGITGLNLLDLQDTEFLVKMLRLNTIPMVRFTKLLLPHMQAKGRGLIINMASSAGTIVVPFLTVYAATKTFVIRFSDSLRAELGPRAGITVLVPTPFGVDTPLMKAVHDVAANPQGRLLQDKMVTAAALVTSVLNRGGYDGCVYGPFMHEHMGTILGALPAQTALRGVMDDLVKPRLPKEGLAALNI